MGFCGIDRVPIPRVKRDQGTGVRRTGPCGIEARGERQTQKEFHTWDRSETKRQETSTTHRNRSHRYEGMDGGRRQGREKEPWRRTNRRDIERYWDKLNELEKQAYEDVQTYRRNVKQVMEQAEQLKRHVQDAEEQWNEMETQRRKKQTQHLHTRSMETNWRRNRQDTAKDTLRPLEKRIAGIEKRIQEQERNTQHKKETRRNAMAELDTQLAQRIANLKLKVDAKFETFLEKIKQERRKQIAELKEIAARNMTETLHPTLQAASEEINVTLEAFAHRIEDKERDVKQAEKNMPSKVQEEVDKQGAELEPRALQLKIDRATKLRRIDLDLLTTFERDVRQEMEDLCEKVALIQAQDTEAIESINEQVDKLTQDVSRTERKLEQVSSAIEDGTLQPGSPAAPPEDGEEEVLRVLEELKRKLRFCGTRLEQEMRQLHDVSMRAT